MHIEPDAPQVSVAPQDRLGERLQAAERLIYSDAEQAKADLLEIQALAQAAGDLSSEAMAVMLQGNALFFQSRFQQADACSVRAIELAQVCGNQMIHVRALNVLGISAAMQGDYTSAMEYCLECLRIAEAIGDEGNQGRVLSNIGVLRMNIGEYEAALEAVTQAQQIAVRQENVVAYSASTINILVAHYYLKQYDRALALAAQHLTEVRKYNLRQNEVVMQAYVAHALFETGQFQQAADLATEVLPLAEEVGNQEHVVNLRSAYGRALHALDRHDEAAFQLETALGVARERELRALERNILGYLSELCASREDWRLAYAYSRQHQELQRVLHTQDSERRSRVLSVQMQVEMLKREAERERQRNAELSQANTALEQAQQHLAYRATHDALTGLHNRAHFQAEAERHLADLSGGELGMLFIDLDRFKQVNDTLGHDVGDELLDQVGQRLRNVVRTGDLVARLGGDEFTLLLPGLRDASDAERVARKVLASLAQPFQVGGHKLHITGSIGVAVAPQDGMDITTMQKHADVAMYRAKHDGKNAVRTYSAGMGDETAARMDLERDLREALRNGEFVLHYQGQFDVASGALSGYEALVRWQHPVHGMIAPGRFIPVAEDSGLIGPLGTWVLREACRQARAWRADERGLTMSVNVSPVQFDTADFARLVQEALEEAGIRPECLMLELTESTVLRDVASATQQLQRLRALGVRIALDDFGTGQSALSLLRHIPIDQLKIDRSFLPGPDDTDESAQVFLRLLVMLGQARRLNVVAEGVENAEHQALLREMGCPTAQGFYLSRPLPAHQATALLPQIAAPAARAAPELHMASD
ncbi:EAL domain-containing protein [Deinococcus deserti]|uniref:Putative diguanylate cyclase/phosphodiesterase n=1 Tax=Deinococcus deserti (strain DSM 17065 / CIP 109153 / LMG 22923 / VCD115) TaxID=546414 RepID=C1CZG3_DEIDV|nr:EAL domain-containing protein [Deinococcus deserti]ACO47211.2 putative diguanylate cyclase/phosphodiesterase [Deinococcus deserti VCD115]